MDRIAHKVQSAALQHMTDDKHTMKARQYSNVSSGVLYATSYPLILISIRLGVNNAVPAAADGRPPALATCHSGKLALIPAGRGGRGGDGRAGGSCAHSCAPFHKTLHTPHKPPLLHHHCYVVKVQSHTINAAKCCCCCPVQKAGMISCCGATLGAS